MTGSPADTQRWGEVLGKADLFGQLEQPVLEALCSSFRDREILPSHDLVRQGEDGESLFVVLEGRLEVIQDGKALPPLGVGGVFDEAALLLGGRRPATLRAVERTRVLELSRPRFEQLLEQHALLMEPLSSALHERIRRARIAGYLQDLFGALEADELREIERDVTWVQLASGRELFHEGDTADGAYIVAVGRLRVVVEVAGVERTLNEVGPGQWVGEMALLTKRERSATVYAVRDTDLVWLSQAAFERLIERHPRATLGMARLLVTRLQRHTTSAALRSTESTTLAILPASPEVDIGAFTKQLVDALSRYGSLLHLNADVVDAHLGKTDIARVSTDDPAHLRLAQWLLAREETHRVVVYETDARWSNWTERAIRHADHIIVVADSRRLEDRTEVQARLNSSFAKSRVPKQSLVLLHDSTRTTYPGTARWLASWKMDHHHHVRRQSRSDLARLARRLTNNSINLVLGGGGSRGLAHVGVLRAFEELGIPVDAIAGTSIGAMVGGPAAMGMNAKEILATCAPLLAKGLDPTLPLVSLLAGKRFVEALEKTFGTLDIEDLPIPFFCVSTNLTRGEEVVHRHGPVVTALRASASIPGIFPPVPWKGDLLVDGGLANNVPVDVMASLFGGAVVGVNVIPSVDLRAHGNEGFSVSGWRVALGKVNPFGTPVDMPNILNILMRTVTTASHSLRKAEESTALTALYLQPPVDNWNLVDFKAAAPIADQGYRGTINELRAWWSGAQSGLLGRAEHG